MFSPYPTGAWEGTEAEIYPGALLRESFVTLREAVAFGFTAEITYDEVLPSGRKLQFGGKFNADVRRPDRLRAVYDGDLRTASLWFDGENFTLFDRKSLLYGSASAPGTLDRLLDRLVEDFGFSLPVADFLYSDPYSAMSERIEKIFYAGLHYVGGVRSHHLAVKQEDIDWQLWVGEEEPLVPRKLTITYKNLPGSPQYTAVFSNWKFGPGLPDRHFIFDPPAGAERVDFLPGRELSEGRRAP